MANQVHLDILGKGVEAWNKWRSQNNAAFRPDLASSDLTGTDLSGAHLYGANLDNSRLVMADLSAAWLTNATLLQADLMGANLTGAHLVMTDLRGANLQGADITRAVVGWTVFGSPRFGDVTGLSSLIHEGPSFVGLDALYLSGRRIPTAFLRGIGAPEAFIAYADSLLGTPIEFYSVFISYSTTDQPFADRLYADLQAKGVRCWFAPHDVQGGRKIHEQIDEAIRVYDKLLMILSEASMNSMWVKTEIASARAREVQQKRQMLFPISLAPFEHIRAWKLFDADTGIDSAREIREYFVPDFSNWKDHDSYGKAFERLLRDLKAESRAPAPA